MEDKALSTEETSNSKFARTLCVFNIYKLQLTFLFYYYFYVSHNTYLYSIYIFDQLHVQLFFRFRGDV